MLGQQVMNCYFQCPTKVKKFRGRKRTTLPIVIDNDIKEAAQQMQSRHVKKNRKPQHPEKNSK